MTDVRHPTESGLLPRITPEGGNGNSIGRGNGVETKGSGHGGNKKGRCRRGVEHLP